MTLFLMMWGLPMFFILPHNLITSLTQSIMKNNLHVIYPSKQTMVIVTIRLGFTIVITCFQTHNYRKITSSGHQKCIEFETYYWLFHSLKMKNCKTCHDCTFRILFYSCFQSEFPHKQVSSFPFSFLGFLIRTLVELKSHPRWHHRPSCLPKH